MTINQKITALVTTMVMCHENNDFTKLKSLMDKSTLEDKDTFFTQDKFEEVSGKIHEQLGSFIKIEYMGLLNKENSIHTLWKANYANTSEDTLWQAILNLDEENPKIIRMSVN